MHFTSNGSPEDADEVRRSNTEVSSSTAVSAAWLCIRSYSKRFNLLLQLRIMPRHALSHFLLLFIQRAIFDNRRAECRVHVPK